MKNTLYDTPVAQHAQQIFGKAETGSVVILKAATGSGKSLVSPVALHLKLGGPVIVLVPSIDVAKENAKLIAELTGMNWTLGNEVGYCAGGQYVNGRHIMLVTYGAFVVRKNLRERNWAAYMLDESHVEQWQVEVARGDIHDALERNESIVVVEASATMDGPKLVNYWGAVGNIDVYYYEIEGAGTPFQQELIEVSTYGASNFAEGKTCAREAVKRLAAGDQFILVSQPGLVEVERCADLIYSAAQKDEHLPSVEIFTYHGDTDPDEIRVMLGKLDADVCRIIVTTPRLLTGMNLKNLDTVVTDGQAKYPESDANGNSALRKGKMSQNELIQALGRTGRFKDGRLILCSDWGMDERPLVMVPEVARLSSLPLALGLVTLGRNPLSVSFCNQPRDLLGSMVKLREWGFVDTNDDVTDLGLRANQLEIRPDIANFLLGVWFDADTKIETLALAVVMASVMENGGVALRHNTDKEGKFINPPTLNFTSDIFNEALRFLEVIQWKTERVKGTNWVSRRGLSRCKGGIYRLISKLQDDTLSDYFEGIYAADTTAKRKGNKSGVKHVSPSREAWRTIAAGISGVFEKHRPVILRHLIRTMGPSKLHHAVSGFNGAQGRDMDSRSTRVDNKSRARLHANQLFLANTLIIQPNHGGGAFAILKDITLVTVDELVEALPELYRTERQTIGQDLLEETIFEETLFVHDKAFTTNRCLPPAEVDVA